MFPVDIVKFFRSSFFYRTPSKYWIENMEVKIPVQILV